MTAANDLARQADQVRHEPLEIHLHDFSSLLFVSFTPSPLWCRQHQAVPRLERPGQARHHHVRPVAVKIVQRPHLPFQLRDQVLLIAAVVGDEHDLFTRTRPVVGDVEEVPVLVEKLEFAFHHVDLLTQRDQAIDAIAPAGPVFELGHVLPLQHEVLVLLPDHHLLFDVVGPGAWPGLGVIPRRAFEPFPRGVIERLGPRDQGPPGVAAEDERDLVGVVPRVQLPGLSEVGVAAKQDRLEPGLPAERHRAVQVRIRLLVAGTIRRAVHQVERLFGVGQRDQQRMVSPLPVVTDAHALLAFAGGRRDRAIGIEDRAIEERRGLMLPDVDPDVVDRVHQRQQLLVGDEASAEVSGGGGVGDTPGTQRVEVGFVVAEGFQVL